MPRLAVRSATLASTPIKARLASVCSWRLIEGVGSTMIARLANRCASVALGCFRLEISLRSFATCVGGIHHDLIESWIENKE